MRSSTEVFNVFDQPVFFSPLIDFGTATFGQLRRDGGFPRTLQLMARVAWQVSRAFASR
jgi:hypothetical protein